MATWGSDPEGTPDEGPDEGVRPTMVEQFLESGCVLPTRAGCSPTADRKST
jgi:hypothetical protein